MKGKTRYKAKLIIIPIMIFSFIYTGIELSQFSSKVETISFSGTQNFLIISILPPIILGIYYYKMIQEQRKINDFKEKHK